MKTLTRCWRAGLVALVVLVIALPANAQAKKHSAGDLAIGKVAPEIAGVDIDGAKFKLSDYRGKVVVLDFWGDW